MMGCRSNYRRHAQTLPNLARIAILTMLTFIIIMDDGIIVLVELIFEVGIWSIKKQL